MYWAAIGPKPWTETSNTRRQNKLSSLQIDYLRDFFHSSRKLTNMGDGGKYGFLGSDIPVFRSWFYYSLLCDLE
jgi:hypothetical protein